MSIARKSGVSATGSLSQSAVQRARKRQNRNQPRRYSSQSSQPQEQRPTKINPFSPQRTSLSRAEVNKPKLRSIPIMPSAQAIPSWLERLYSIHRYSSISAFLLVIVTLVVYGLTVYSQELWSQSYRKLQNLNRQERQLMTTNEVLKSNMAKQAQKQPEKLLSPTPDRMIFVTPAPVTSTSMSPDSKPPTSEIQQETLNPTGY
jgi:hypothetical protein